MEPQAPNPNIFLHIDNLHCQSCVEYINQIITRNFARNNLETARTVPSDVVFDIPNRRVSFAYPHSRCLDPILKQLDAAGFEVRAEYESGQLSTPLARTRPSGWRWLRGRFSLPHTKSTLRETRHREICNSCRTSSHSTPEKKDLCETRFVIGGMTCSSCTSAISAGLSPSSEAGVISSQVTLLPPSAVVLHDANILSTDNIKDLIEEIGYEAEFVSSKKLSPTLEPIGAEGANREPASYKVVFSILGMTCASCVLSIIRAMEGVPETMSQSVDLMGNTGSIVVMHKEEAELVRKEINDVGYECTIVKIIEQFDDTATEGPVTRTIDVKIDGMHSDEDVRVVAKRLENLAERHEFTFTSVSLENPSITITYLPDPPVFTSRHIRDEIASSGFTLSIVHVNTTEDRAARARALEQQNVLVLFSITTLFAIPTFIISVLGMSLLPPTNSFRMNLESPVWGNASRGNVAAFLLATPVQFGVGSFFYKHSWKSLRGVWRRRRAGSDWRRVWFERLFKWGSMDTLVTLGTSTGYFASLALLILDINTQPREGMMGGEMSWFDSSVFLMFFILSGRYLESISKQRTGDAIPALSSTRPTTGLLYTHGVSNTHAEPVDFLEVGDIVIVPVGSSPPLDGTLLTSSPSTTFNESSLTGESRPVFKSAGDIVLSGTTNAGPAAVIIEITNEPGKTMLDGIVDVVRDAMGKKTGIERIVDVVTGYFVPCIVGIAVLTIVVWCLRGYFGGLLSEWIARGDGQRTGGWILFAIQFGVAVLVVACPCGIGLAAPTAQLVGIGLAAQNGVLSNGGGEAFQTITAMNTVVFDKTGTLTTGKFSVACYKILADGPSSQDLVCAILLAAEQASTHPLAIGVREWSHAQIVAKSIPVDLVTAEEIPGRGVKATLVIEGMKVDVAIGNQKLMEDVNAKYESDQISSRMEADILKLQTSGHCVILLSAKIVQDLSGALNIPINTSHHTMLGVFGMHDPARPEAATLIIELRRLGMDVWMISGDNPITAKSVARTIGIPDSNVIAGALPADKQKWVETLQSRPRPQVKTGRFSWLNNLLRLRSPAPSPRNIVAFIGDGINDAPALAQADVSLALGTGSFVALSTASFHILASSLLALLTTYDLALATKRKIITNFVWACIYNMGLIPLAAGAFYGVGGHKVKLAPVWGSAAMALSGVSVVVNSLILKWRYKAPKVVREWNASIGQV